MSTSDLEFLVEGREVSKVFKDFWGRPKVTAVDRVDISVRRGSVFGLLGPNGAGKSTLLKMLLGHLFPTSGVLTVMGRHPSDVDAKAAIGYMPEKTVLYKHLTPIQTLKFFGQILELPADVIRSRSEQLLDMVGLGHAKDRIVGEFSHGMGRRMGLAQALLNDPELLLLDEPTAGLDPLGCREVKDLILTLAKRGKTIILTSHLLADVEEVCDELLIMYGGKVQAFGPSRQLLARKETLQLTMTEPSPDCVDKLRAFVKEMGDAAQLSNPTRSLENFFLDVVRDAGKHQQTSGARAGTGVADYLRDAAQEAQSAESKPAAAEHAEPETPTTPELEEPTDMKEEMAEPTSPATQKTEATVQPEKAPETETTPKVTPPSEPTQQSEPQPKSAAMIETTAGEPEPEKNAQPLDDSKDSDFEDLRVGSGSTDAEDDGKDEDEEPEDVDQDLLDSLTK